MEEIKVDDDLSLRVMNVNFAEDGFKLVEKNRAQLTVWLPWVKGTISVKDEINYLKGAYERFQNDVGLEMSIFKRCRENQEENWKFIGSCGLVKINREESFAELGYWLDKDHYGMGIITRCCKKLIHVAFAEMKLKKVKIMAHRDNKPSIAVAKRLKFRLTDEKLTEQNPKFYRDISKVITYAIDYNEWISDP